MTIAALDVGTKVRVLGGPFAGQVGVISELDGRGGARVTLGLLSARVLLENLRPAREAERPSLKSSHHRGHLKSPQKAEPKPPAAEPEGVRGAASRSKKTRSARRSTSK